MPVDDPAAGVRLRPARPHRAAATRRPAEGAERHLHRPRQVRAEHHLRRQHRRRGAARHRQPRTRSARCSTSPTASSSASGGSSRRWPTGSGVKRPKSFPPVPVWLARMLANWRESEVPPREQAAPAADHAGAAQVRRAEPRLLDRQGPHETRLHPACAVRRGDEAGDRLVQVKAGTRVVALQDFPLSSPSPAAVYERTSQRRGAAWWPSRPRGSIGSAMPDSPRSCAGLVVAGLAFGAELFSPWFALVPVVCVPLLRREVRDGPRAEGLGRACRGVLRRRARPAGRASRPARAIGARFADHEHPYADDLDLFGPGSVFERLTACRTRIGEDTLAAWLLAPADPREVKARQEAVARPHAAARPARIGRGRRRGRARRRLPPPRGVGLFAARPPDRTSRPLAGNAGRSSCSAGRTSRRGSAGSSSAPPRCRSSCSASRRWRWRCRSLPWSRRVLAPLERAERDLSLLESVLARLEREPFTAPRLKELQAAMMAEGRRASAQIRELRQPPALVQLAAQPALPAGRDPAHVGRAVRVQARGLADALRPGGRAVAARRRRGRGAVVAGAATPTRTRRTSFPRSKPAPSALMRWPSATRSLRGEKCVRQRRDARRRGRPARAHGQRLEHVGQEHALARGRRERRCSRWRAAWSARRRSPSRRSRSARRCACRIRSRPGGRGSSRR